MDRDRYEQQQAILQRKLKHLRNTWNLRTWARVGSAFSHVPGLRPIQGADATFSSPGLDHNPKQILISVNLRGRGRVWLLGDGTITQILPP